jgi:uncharacterized membrane protein YpjA
LTWAIPFGVSLAFFGRNGQPVLGLGIIKSIMAVVGSATGAVLLVRLFGSVKASARSGLAIGLVWLAMNIVLDLIVLVPVTKMALSDYFGEIALRYLVIPIMAAAIGDAGAKQRSCAAGVESRFV